jgi:uncharacterized membrane protein YgaE (UPF0421/DUF939 family)
MNERVKNFLIYALKCAAGVLTVFTIASLFKYTDISWCLISVMLVLSADGKDSLSLAVTRIKANVVGAGVGVIWLLIFPVNMWALSAALAAALGLCYIFKLDTGIRSALAATIIIMLHQEGSHVWDTALERIIAVLSGCAIALIITFLFHFKTKPAAHKSNANQQEA